MTQALPMAGTPATVNLAGLSKNDYRGSPTTLCRLRPQFDLQPDCQCYV